ncbi:MAG: T9SS type A sorting domain-containing protein [Candidatus Zixiibacteriota bacterium]
MMQKRKLNSLLLISFLVVFAFSYSFADTVVYQSKADFQRCTDGYLNVQVTVEDNVKAIEIVFEVYGDGDADFTVTDVDWKGSFALLNDYRYIDLSRIHTDGPDTVRLAAIDITSGNVLTPGTYDVANIFFTTNRACSGVITVDDETWKDYVNPTGTIQTQFVLEDASLVLPTTTYGTVELANIAPTIDDIPNYTMHWGDDYSVTASADDDDVAACEKLTYSLVTFPTGMTINPTTGAIFWSTDGSDIGLHSVQVMVTDSCGASATNAEYTICVENDPPEITCPADMVLPWGVLVEADVTAIDPDDGPNELSFSLLDFTGPGTPTVDAVTGHFSWQTETTSDYTGTFTATVVVTDNGNLDPPCAPENADTCSFDITLVAHQVTIEKVHDQLQGQYTTVELNMLDDTYVNYPMGGFDFLISYDASALTFIEADMGQMLVECDWEYFEYRTGPFGNCGSGCPSGMIRIVAMAEYNDGPYHPTCFTNDGVNTHSPQLAVLTFLVTNDYTYNCNFVPIRFTWLDCGDNTISNVAGDILFISAEVWDYFGDDGVDTYVEITNFDEVMPSIYGAPIFCDTVNDKTDPYRFIKFLNGGIDIICVEDIDARGDLNMDGLSNTIADAVMFTNYFVYGLSAFGAYVDGAIAATDVNNDGLTLTVADLVYMIRIVTGDELGYPKLAPVEATVTYSKTGVISIDGPEMGAVYVVFEGDVNPINLTSNMEMLSASRDGMTYTLLWSRDGEACTGTILNADANIVSIEMATKDAAQVTSNLLPAEFALEQNYPNPFNPTTTIQFSLKERADFVLTIYNVTGQVVESFAGSNEAGTYEIEWNASNVASGVYFYRLTTGNYTETKKMVLLK